MKRKGPAQIHQPPISGGVPEVPPEGPPKRKRGRPRGSGTNKAAAGTRMVQQQQVRGHQIEQPGMQLQHSLQGHPVMERGKTHDQYQQQQAQILSQQQQQIHPPHDSQDKFEFDSLDKTLRYECKEKLGEGTYGVVYKGKVTVLAQQQSQRTANGKDWKGGGFLPQQNNDDVAVKRFKAIKDSEGISTTIYREMCLLRELSHDNIIKLRDVVLQPEKKMLCLVYEYGESDLFKIEKYRKDPFKISEIKSIMWQILCGIKYMHENWVIHRDIKPSNILVSNGTIKIADFGLARIFRRPLKNLSDNGVVVTIWYRAFELLVMTKHYTPAIDVWAIGCIFGELFKKRAMFQGTEKMTNELQEDQLDKIIRILGTPKGFTRPEIVEAMPKYHEVIKKWANIPCTLDENYKEIDEEGKDLLKKMLCYDPISRITAEEALKHPYFAKNDFDKSRITGMQDSRY